ncbi:hypothetical protein VIGAN_04273100 [Vigna angularis var. angularis]|uniref:Uncharacterized protein n=1 Tax=Vigna angularis var. angularis TaxID=157739 RepID=A0A0S3RX94_PHAAN|nr:hypothetical protein VIGAN_04273100 [Vigna angularis var. angularis]
MLMTRPPFACAWPCREWPWPLAATFSSEANPISKTCFMVRDISETVFGCSTARGGKWCMLPKSLAASSLLLRLK